jgi:hypothetical protein
VTDKLSAELLIKEHLELKDWLADANKRFAEFLAPKKARLEQIDGLLLEKLNAETDGDRKSISTDAGTCYVSNILNVGIDPEGEPYVNEGGESQVGRMALLDFALENWADIGADLLLVQPQKDAVKRYLEENGRPPPGLKVGWFTRVNVRRS